jgi:competence protein ComEA
MTIKPWVYFLLGLLSALLASGLILLISSQPRGNPVILIPPPTPSPIYVDISGEVNSPGLYSIPKNSRLENVIEAAGGLTGEADNSRINLAEIVHDGDKITIPPKNDLARANPLETTPSAEVTFPININLATLSELEHLPGIGPTKAQAIMDYRNAHNAFSSIDEITDVPGIGDTIFQEIKEFITVDN